VAQAVFDFFLSFCFFSPFAQKRCKYRRFFRKVKIIPGNIFYIYTVNLNTPLLLIGDENQREEMLLGSFYH